MVLQEAAWQRRPRGFSQANPFEDLSVPPANYAHRSRIDAVAQVRSRRDPDRRGGAHAGGSCP